MRQKGLDNGLEVEVDKNRNLLSDREMGSNNGAGRVIVFMDFREEVENEVRELVKYCGKIPLATSENFCHSYVHDNHPWLMQP